MENYEFEALKNYTYSRYKWDLEQKIDFNKYDRADINKILITILDWKNFRAIDDYYLEIVWENKYNLVKPWLDWNNYILWKVFVSWVEYIFFPQSSLKDFFDDTNFPEDDRFEISKDNEKIKILNYFKKISQQLLLKIKNSN